ncbi:uncharacterized protein LOC62_03G003896 [Vanrija pseudolonga]|uniref:Uncharacterized protein n=1 Tax=Vanrija pseudolonga TaxID=143232 RepID=A0AAF0Y5J3_9TREE|nr:hypothetical protein LOC62_03G003896 [Vanrija pseudolonga]
MSHRHECRHLKLTQLTAYASSTAPAADTVVLFLPTRAAEDDAHLGVAPGTRRLVVTYPSSIETVPTPTGLTVPSSVREVVLHFPAHAGAQDKAPSWATIFLRVLFTGMWRTGMRPKVIVVGPLDDALADLRYEVERGLGVQFIAEVEMAAELGIPPTSLPSGGDLDELLGALELVGPLDYRQRVGDELFQAETVPVSGGR